MPASSPATAGPSASSRATGPWPTPSASVICTPTSLIPKSAPAPALSSVGASLSGSLTAAIIASIRPSRRSHPAPTYQSRRLSVALHIYGQALATNMFTGAAVNGLEVKVEYPTGDRVADKQPCIIAAVVTI